MLPFLLCSHCIRPCLLPVVLYWNQKKFVSACVCVCVCLCLCIRVAEHLIIYMHCTSWCVCVCVRWFCATLWVSKTPSQSRAYCFCTSARCAERDCLCTASLTLDIRLCCVWWQWQRREATEGQQLELPERQWSGRGQHQQRQPGWVCGWRRRIQRGRFIYRRVFWTQAPRLCQWAQWTRRSHGLNPGSNWNVSSKSFQDTFKILLSCCSVAWITICEGIKLSQIAIPCESLYIL